MNVMTQSNYTMAEQIAVAVIAFQQQLTGHKPKAVTVVISGETLVVTLHRPRGKDLADKQELMQVRHFLERSGTVAAGDIRWRKFGGASKMGVAGTNQDALPYAT